MRVIAGRARGRRLVAPPGLDVRPTSDRVREATFAMVESWGPAVGAPVAGAAVVDLFAGTGALGVEALSRGAASATFVDEARPALDAVRANLAATGLGGPAAKVVRAEAVAWCAGAGPFDLAFADPPYAFSAWGALLANLTATLAVLESDRELDVGPGWAILRSRRYGGTVVTLVRPAGAATASSEGATNGTTSNGTA